MYVPQVERPATHPIHLRLLTTLNHDRCLLCILVSSTCIVYYMPYTLHKNYFRYSSKYEFIHKKKLAWCVSSFCCAHSCFVLFGTLPIFASQLHCFHKSTHYNTALIIFVFHLLGHMKDLILYNNAVKKRNETHCQLNCDADYYLQYFTHDSCNSVDYYFGFQTPVGATNNKRKLVENRGEFWTVRVWNVTTAVRACYWGHFRTSI